LNLLQLFVVKQYFNVEFEFGVADYRGHAITSRVINRPTQHHFLARMAFRVGSFAWLDNGFDFRDQPDLPKLSMSATTVENQTKPVDYCTRAKLKLFRFVILWCTH
jgi:hypothetical protein